MIAVTAAVLAWRRHWLWLMALVLSAVLGATALVVLVALSRMVLGVHYLSDVLAAIAEGAAWLRVCIVGTRTYWQYRADTLRGG